MIFLEKKNKKIIRVKYYLIFLLLSFISIGFALENNPLRTLSVINISYCIYIYYCKNFKFNFIILFLVTILFESYLDMCYGCSITSFVISSSILNYLEEKRKLGTYLERENFVRCFVFSSFYLSIQNFLSSSFDFSSENEIYIIIEIIISTIFFEVFKIIERRSKSKNPKYNLVMKKNRR